MTILSIAIPTFNGSAYILDTLDSIQNQINDCKSQIEVVISDNASNDGTDILIKNYQRNTTLKIFYSKNGENLGFDKNVDLCIQQSSGKYVWLLGDDDLLKADALSTVLKILHAHPKLKALLVNFEQFNRNLEKLENQTAISQARYCNDADSFLRHSKARYNLVSSLIFERSAWNSIDVTRGIGSNFIHVYALFKIILMGDSYIHNLPLINMRMNSQKASGDGYSALQIAIDSGKIIRQMKGMGHNQKIINFLMADVRNYTFDTLIIAKLSGLNHPLKLSRDLISTFNGPKLWLKYLPVIFMPDILFSKIYCIKKFISCRTKFIEKGLKKMLKNK